MTTSLAAATILADTFLAKEYRTGRIKFNGQGDGHEQRQEYDERNQSARPIERCPNWAGK
jgi:hypothetical protein